jgi:hypothetical protein
MAIRQRKTNTLLQILILKKNKMKKYLIKLTLFFSLLMSANKLQAQSPSWSLSGNAGTVDGTNFIGTTDNIPFNIRVNNQNAGRIDPTLQNVFFGLQAGGSTTTGNHNTSIGNYSLFSNTTGIYNMATGYAALYANTSGGFNMANGANALRYNTSGSFNMAIGYAALYLNTTGSYNISNGYTALYNNTTGVFNMGNGYAALYANTSGSYNTANGSYALRFNTIGGYNTASGYSALYSNTQGIQNTALGYQALLNSSTANNLTAIGFSSLFSNTTGANNTGVGMNTLFTNTNGSNNTALGYGADVSTGTLTNATAIGSGSIVYTSNTIQLGNTGVTRVNVGTGANATLVAGGLQITGGTLGANKVLTSDANGVATWQSPGNSSGWSLTGNSGTVDGSNFIGTTDNKPLNFKVNNNLAGRIDPSLHNSYYGYQSGSANSSGTYITALGNGANVSTDGLTNATAIGNGAIVNASNVVQLGNTSVNKVFVGTGTNATLVAGGLQITGGSLASGKVLTSDGSGVATWQNPAPSGWSLNGNAGTVDGTNFIGTTDNKPFNIRVNNSASGRIDQTLKNAFFGYQSGGVNTTGYNNVFFGNQSGSSNTTGYYNASNGYQALYSNTTGYYNTAEGGSALAFNLTGNFNTANGNGALFNNTNGNHNAANGYAALATNMTGSYNTALGDYADVNADGITNSTAIGSQALITASNQVRIGNGNVTSIGGYSNWTNISDGRVKRNIKQNVPGLDFINKLTPVTYNLDLEAADQIIEGSVSKNRNSNVIQLARVASAARLAKEAVVYTGFVAQDVEKAAKSLNYDFSGVDAAKNNKDLYGLRYSDFVAPLVKAVQELSAENDSLKSQNEQQQQQINELQNQMNLINVKLENLAKGAISSGSAILSSARLEQNIPNPFNQTTLINYYIPESAGHAFIKVSGINGQDIKTIQLNGPGSGQITLQTATLASGNYTYSLYVDGSLIDTKIMVLAR